MRIVFIFIFCAFSTNALAQSWIKNVDDPNENIGLITGAKIDENSFAVELVTLSNKIIIAKFNMSGDTLWTFVINGTINENQNHDVANSLLIATSDKGIVFIHTNDLAETSFYLTKIDSTGNLAWTRKFSPGVNEIFFGKLMLLSDSNLLITYVSDMVHYPNSGFIKLDPNGHYLTSKFYEINYNFPVDIIELSDKSFYAIGNNKVAKLDSSFTIERVVEIPISQDYLQKIITVQNDSLVLLTTSASIIKFDSSFTYLYKRVSTFHYGMDAFPFNNFTNDIIVAGRDSVNAYSQIINNDFDNIQYNQFYNWTSSLKYSLIKIISADSSIIVSQTKLNTITNHVEAVIMKSDLNRTFCYSNSGSVSHYDTVFSPILTNIYLPVTQILNINDTIIPYTSGLHLNSVCTSTNIKENVLNYLTAPYPNPANSNISIDNISKGEKIEITDLLGRKLFSNVFPENAESLKLDISNLKPGIYLLELKDKEIVCNYKFIKQ